MILGGKYWRILPVADRTNSGQGLMSFRPSDLSCVMMSVERTKTADKNIQRTMNPSLTLLGFR